jgi:hypothetical protein
LGAFPALLEKSAGNRAFRSNLFCPSGAKKYFRFNPLRGCKAALFCLFFFIFAGFPARAESGGYGLWLGPGLAVPLGNDNFSSGYGGEGGFEWRLFRYFGLAAAGGYTSLPVADGSAFTILDGSAGPFLTYDINDRFSLGLQGNIGAYRMDWNRKQESGARLGLSLSGDFRFSPYLSLRLFGEYTRYTINPVFQTMRAGLGLRLDLRELLGSQSRVGGGISERSRVFPVSYAWYEKNRLAVMRITNNEAYTIQDIQLSFFLERYMNRPTVFARLTRLAPGESAEFPVTALFNESMMDLTENTQTNAVVAVEYSCLGSRRTSRISVQMPVYHRNAMSWDDDRRAASFVSSRDPAAVYFARYTASVIRENQDKDIPLNVQYALGLFSGMAAYGINYVVDPASSYLEMSENASSLDSLNYPYQTLFYRGGDCDDLSILFCAMLEVLDVPTAFITIPGHIYAAFDTGIESGLAFDTGGTGGWNSRPGVKSRLIEHEGRLWLPVEITIPEQGFYRAWRIGWEEWQAAGGEARIYPMASSWELYPPVSVPGAGGEMPAVPEDGDILRIFSRALNDLK